MPFAPSRFFLLALALGLFASARAQLPALSGELQGDFLLPFADAPKVRWELAVKTSLTGRREGTLGVSAPGLKAAIAVDTDAGFSSGTWRISASEIEPGPWLALLAPQLAPALVGAAVTGTLRLSGEGTLLQGQPAGRIAVEWRDGAVKHNAQGWALEGVAFTGDFSFDGAAKTWSSVAPAKLTVRTIATKRFGARNLALHVQLDDKLVARVDAATVEIAGGEITTAPFVVPLMPPVLDVKLKISRIGLQDVVALVPTGLSAARGRVDGELALGWSKALGLRIGAGHLDLWPDEPMVLSLSPAPGLLSSSMSARFALLPAKFGPLAKWLSLRNPGYADLVAIEMGRTALAVDSLEVRLTPAGDSLGRSARVLINARPEIAGTSVGPVTFEVGVRGPLAYVLRIGAENGATLKLK